MAGDGGLRARRPAGGVGDLENERNGLGGIGATREEVDEDELDEEMTLVFLEREASEGVGWSGWLTAPELVST